MLHKLCSLLFKRVINSSFSPAKAIRIDMIQWHCSLSVSLKRGLLETAFNTIQLLLGQHSWWPRAFVAMSCESQWNQIAVEMWMYFMTACSNSVHLLCLCSYSHLGTEVAEMRKRQQSQNEGTSAVSQAPGNQRPNNTCCFCWCCCCSCSWYVL